MQLYCCKMIILQGIVKPHEIAKEEYLNAIEDKKTAFLGEETKPDIFKVCSNQLNLNIVKKQMEFLFLFFVE